MSSTLFRAELRRLNGRSGRMSWGAAPEGSACGSQGPRQPDPIPEWVSALARAEDLRRARKATVFGAQGFGMPMADYERAADLIERHTDDADFAGPRPPKLIEAAEQALGFRFPATYRRFVAEYGAGSVGGTEIYGVVDADFESSSVPDGVWYNLTLRRDGSDESVYVFYDVGDGETFCLDTTQVAADGEMPVVGVRLGGGDDRDEIAPDFGRALLMLLEDELGLAASGG
jgi:hypothetical protein